MPARILIRVDFPDPFWPSRAWISARRTSRLTSIKGPLPGERLGDSDDLDHRCLALEPAVQRLVGQDAHSERLREDDPLGRR